MALLLLAPSCANAAREGEIACQRRLIELSGGVAVPFAASFANMSRKFERMPLAGCTDEQRGRAEIMARVARDMSTMAERVGEPATLAEQAPDLRTREAFLELATGVEQFEQRRQVLRQDLERMRAEAQ